MALDKCCLCCKLENGAVFMGFFMILINISVYYVATHFVPSNSSLTITIQIGSSLEVLSSILLAIGGATVRIFIDHKNTLFLCERNRVSPLVLKHRFTFITTKPFTVCILFFFFISSEKSSRHGTMDYY